MAAFTLAVTLLFSGFALARDDDDYYRRGGSNQAQQYGYQNGFHSLEQENGRQDFGGRFLWRWGSAISP